MTCHDLYLAEPSTTTAVETRPRARRIVVGVDGSAGSVAALRWARQQAELADAEVIAVDVVQPVVPPAFVGGFMPATAIGSDQLSTAAHATIDRVIRDTGDNSGRRPRHLVVEDPSPARTLLRVADGASMVVVGAHHHSGLGFLLGSTGNQCIRHAACPVVVVPENWTDRISEPSP